MPYGKDSTSKPSARFKPGFQGIAPSLGASRSSRAAIGGGVWPQGAKRSGWQGQSGVSIGHKLTLSVDKQWAAVAQQRLHELESGKVQAISAEEVFKRCNDRISKRKEMPTRQVGAQQGCLSLCGMRGRNRMIVARFALITCIVFGSALAIADDASYPNTSWMGGDVNTSAGWYEQCMAVKDEQPPAIDSAVGKEEKCDPFDLYSDAKNKQNPSESDWLKVRSCAFSRREDRVLMMLYANGLGVKRNYRLALNYACKIGEAPAEVEGRVAHLVSEMEAQNHQVFDWCDDVTRSENVGICMSIAERQKDKVRYSKLGHITSKWTESQKKTYSRLEVAFWNFVSARGQNEAEQVGMARYYDDIRVGAEEFDAFVSYMEQLEQGKIEKVTHEQFVSVDKLLNDRYQKALHSNADRQYGSTGNGIKATQKLWLKYRDAWDDLLRVKYPSVDRQAWKAILTDRRVDQLKEFSNE